VLTVVGCAGGTFGALTGPCLILGSAAGVGVANATKGDGQADHSKEFTSESVEEVILQFIEWII
jgi:hypothetical protein